MNEVASKPPSDHIRACRISWCICLLVSACLPPHLRLTRQREGDLAHGAPLFRTGWHVDQAILAEEDRVVVIRFGHDYVSALLNLFHCPDIARDGTPNELRLGWAAGTKC